MENQEHLLNKINQLEAENKTLQEHLEVLKYTSDDVFPVIQQRQMSVEKQKESEIIFKRIFEYSAAGSILVTEDMEICRMNNAMLALLGYTDTEDFKDKRIITITCTEHKEDWNILHYNLWVKNLPSYNFQTCLNRKDGSVLWCEVNAISFLESNTAYSYTIFKDITRLKQQEEAFKHVLDEQQMHLVAHDLKNPLHNIKTVSGFLKYDVEQSETLKPANKMQYLSFISLITKSCETAYSLIKDMLVVGKLEAEKLEKESTDMADFLKAQVQTNTDAALEKGITIYMNIPEKPVYVPVNRDKFQRVIENLMSNAIKFTHSGGRIDIALTEKTESILIEITDNGIGIPEALQDSVFNKFTKANRKGTEGETTTGLGLFIVKQIVDLHQGRIWFESKEKQGTSFFIELQKSITNA